MHNDWSRYVQTPEELYRSRALRFHDGTRELWLDAIGAREGMDILEIGCGSGLFSHRLKQYLPGVHMTGLDRDSGLLAYAGAKAAELALDCDYVCGDALAMPFGDACFDLCYSHTVMEHLPARPFLREQYRVLRPGGRVTALSVRTNASLPEHGADDTTPEEQALWGKLSGAGEGKLPIPVCAWPLTESEYPKALEEAGFCCVDVKFFCVTYYAPDAPSTPPATALEQIEVGRLCALEEMAKTLRLAPDALSGEERRRLAALINARFDERIAAWRRGEKRWDMTAKMMLAATGVKPSIFPFGC